MFVGPPDKSRSHDNMGVARSSLSHLWQPHQPALGHRLRGGSPCMNAVACGVCSVTYAHAYMTELRRGRRPWPRRTECTAATSVLSGRGVGRLRSSWPLQRQGDAEDVCLVLQGAALNSSTTRLSRGAPRQFLCPSDMGGRQRLHASTLRSCS
jgi:hypothetical protein